MARTEIDDQLPYIQVHRSVGLKAAQLATPLGVTYQHVRGALDVFWEGIADRRVLGEAIDGAHRAGREPDLVFSASETERRLQRAFGQKVDPRLLEGDFLEPAEGGGWRVLGADRYLNAERSRLGRKRGDTGVTPGSDPDDTPSTPRSHPDDTPVPPGSDPAKTRGKTKEVRGEREEEGPPPVVVKPVPLPASPDNRFASGDAYWAHVQNRRHEAGGVVERPPDPRRLSSWWSEVGMELNGDYEALDDGLARFGSNKHWEHSNPPWPFAAFMKNWRDYVRR